jgi:hypothetical protein
MWDMHCRGRCRLAGLLTVALSAGCGAGEAKYPEGSQSISCTNLVDDCSAQASAQCPSGYTVLHRETWSSDLDWRKGQGGSHRTPVRHTSIRILCAS